MELKDILLDREGGAMSLLKRAVIWLAEHPECLAPPHRDDTLAILRTTRPVMSAFARLADHIEGRRDPDWRALSAELAESDGLIARRFRENLRNIKPVQVVTLSWSATVLRALRECAMEIEAVAILESHPGGEGAAFAQEVRTFHTNVTLFRDEQLDEAVRASTIGVIGADTVFADGSVVNKVLSVKLAESLVSERKPLYVLASRWKRADSSVAGTVTEPDLFEIVPARWISRVIAES